MSRTYTPEQKIRYNEYREMNRMKQRFGHLKKANETPYSLAFITDHLPPPWNNKTIHHVGISSNDACTMVIIFTDGTQTNLNF